MAHVVHVGFNFGLQKGVIRMLFGIYSSIRWLVCKSLSNDNPIIISSINFNASMWFIERFLCSCASMIEHVSCNLDTFYTISQAPMGALPRSLHLSWDTGFSPSNFCGRLSGKTCASSISRFQYLPVQVVKLRHQKTWEKIGWGCNV